MVVELGGQDAKIIVFKDDNASGRKKKILSMNGKCAVGTGAVINKINAKLKIPIHELSNQGYTVPSSTRLRVSAASSRKPISMACKRTITA